MIIEYEVITEVGLLCSINVLPRWWDHQHFSGELVSQVRFHLSGSGKLYNMLSTAAI